MFTRVHPSIELIVFFFNDFLSDSVEITSCEYTETITLLKNPLDVVSGNIHSKRIAFHRF